MAKLYFRYSSMNAGKSTALLQVAYNYQNDLEQGILIYTSEIDDRFGIAKVSSRLGISQDAYTFNKKTDFIEDVHKHTENDYRSENLHLKGTKKNLACILIDEAQFLTYKHVVELHKVAHLFKIPVICYGIRTDFAGQAFEGSAALLALADALEELKTVCSLCKKQKATMNPRVDDNGYRVLEGPQIGIEGNAYKYLPMCPKCFYESQSV